MIFVMLAVISFSRPWLSSDFPSHASLFLQSCVALCIASKLRIWKIPMILQFSEILLLVFSAPGGYMNVYNIIVVSPVVAHSQFLWIYFPLLYYLLEVFYVLDCQSFVLLTFSCCEYFILNQYYVTYSIMTRLRKFLVHSFRSLYFRRRKF